MGVAKFLINVILILVVLILILTIYAVVDHRYKNPEIENEYIIVENTKNAETLNEVLSEDFETCEYSVEDPAPNYGEIESAIKSQDFFSDLPRRAKVTFVIYTLKEGCRRVDKIYYINNNLLTEVLSSDADIEIYLDIKHARNLDETNFCQVASAATNAGELDYTINVGNLKLASTYLSLTKYKECFGF